MQISEEKMRGIFEFMGNCAINISWKKDHIEKHAYLLICELKRGKIFSQSGLVENWKNKIFDKKNIREIVCVK
jgi:hypothetical protein